jgi:hypothetical protein
MRRVTAHLIHQLRKGAGAALGKMDLQRLGALLNGRLDLSHERRLFRL